MATISALSAPAKAHKPTKVHLILTVLLLACLSALMAAFPAHAELLHNGDYAAYEHRQRCAGNDQGPFHG